MALHPQVQEVVDEINAIEVPPLSERPLAEVREAFHEMIMGLQAPGVAVGRVEERDIPGPNGPIRIRLYWPEGADAARRCRSTSTTTAAAMWCSASTPTTMSARALCKGAGCIVVGSATARRRRTGSRSRRKTPGRRSSGWRRTVPNRRRPGAHRGRRRDSAGGCLAAVTAQRAAREGGPALVFQLLVYPVTDTDEERESYRTFGEGYVLTAEAMTWFFDCYFSDEAERSDVRAAPIRADDLSGLAPRLVMTRATTPCSTTAAPTPTG